MLTDQLMYNINNLFSAQDDIICHLLSFWWQCRYTKISLSIQVVCLYVGCYLSLPLIPVVEQLLFVVQQLLVRLSGEFKVWTLRNRLIKKIYIYINMELVVV